MRSSLPLLILFMALLPAIALAEWHATAETTISSDDNIFLNNTPEKDIISTTVLSLQHVNMGEPWSTRFSYEGTFTLFAEHTDLDYLFQHADFSARKQLAGENWLQFGILAEQHMDFDPSAIYGYEKLLGSTNAQITIHEDMSLLTGYSMGWYTYNELSAWNNLEHKLFGNLKMLKGKTTLLFSTAIDLRHYLSPLVIDTDTGNQEGKSANNAPADKSATIFYNGQWINTLSMSTPLIDEQTGMRLWLKNRINFGDPDASIAKTDKSLYSYDPLFDDHYGYESREFGGLLSRILPYAFMGRIGYEYALKRYQYVETAQQGRHDTKQTLWARLEKTMAKSKEGATTLSIYGECMKIWNSSNITTYQYHDLTIELGMELGF